MSRVIAIDGPSGAGKSSVSKLVGSRLGFLHVDSGALYRIMTWQALVKHIDTDSPAAVAAFAPTVEIECRVENGAIAYYVDGEAPGDRIRKPEINAHASQVATVKEVRDRITALLRDMVKYGDLVIEGRDITTAVFPDSPARFYLTASAEARARRRQKEEVEKGIANQSAEDVKKSLLARDAIDSTRKYAPLKKADGALEIDSSDLTLNQVVEAVIAALPEDWRKKRMSDVAVSRPRYVILDALRGLAGVSVVLLHLSEAYFHRPIVEGVARSPIVPSHGYLAVEFFILLMGYMLGFAYDRRWDKGMTVREFFARRLIRLHPLVISGVLIGLGVWFINPAMGYWPNCGFDKISSCKACVLALWAMTMVPLIGYSHVNPFNACSWTLYYEYIGNFLYATFVRRLSRLWLWLLAIVSLYFLSCTIFKVDPVAVFGIHSEFFARTASHRFYSLVGGPNIESLNQVYQGFMRLFFAFFYGLVLSRMGWKIRLPRFAFSITLVIFALVMFAPFGYGRGLDNYGWLNGIFELLALTIIFPLLILIGVGSEAHGERRAAVSKFFGELSYPLYMTHFPLYYLFVQWVSTRSMHYSFAVNCLVSLLVFILLLLISYAVMEWWDKPIQRFLQSRRQSAAK